MLTDEDPHLWVTTEDYGTGRPILRPAQRQSQLAALAESWEPHASQTPPVRRLSRCASCGKRVWFPWHLWLDAGGFKKELHVCNRCVRKRGWA